MRTQLSMIFAALVVKSYSAKVYSPSLLFVFKSRVDTHL